MTPRSSKKRSVVRLAWLSILMAFAFVGMGARLFMVQILSAPAFAELAADQRERVIEFPARRGGIFDRNGEPLAISVDVKTIYADPALVDDAKVAAKGLSRILDLDPATVEKALHGRVPGSRFEFIARQVDPRVASKVEALELPGIFMRDEPKRYYPGGSLASHVLGMTDTDGHGIGGIEAEYDRVLRGTPGREVLEQDPAGNSLPQADYSYKRPRPGRSLFLTIDKQLQYFTELTLAEGVREYHAASGTAIVMSASTGEILALANVPDFNPNDPGKASPDALRNKAISDVYEPGSAYKVVTLAGALEEGIVTAKTAYDVPDSFVYYDRTFNDSHGHETARMTVRQIIEQSSNVGTIKIALELGGVLLESYIQGFGFGSETGVDFPGESSGIVVDRDDWSGTSIATIPIGQGIAVTPLQMAAAYAALANGGQWVQPHFVSATLDARGELQQEMSIRTRPVVSESTANEIVKILCGVVEKGTGIAAQIPGYKVAGKTGTAQKPLPTGGYGNSYVASFAGFAPATRPEIVVLVVLDNPSPIWGGYTAAPIFRTITEFALRHLGVPPTGDAERAAAEIEAERTGAAPIHD